MEKTALINDLILYGLNNLFEVFFHSYIKFVTHIYPARIFNRVLFPAPEGPIIAVNSPDLNSPLTPCKISFFTKIK